MDTPNETLPITDNVPTAKSTSKPTTEPSNVKAEEKKVPDLDQKVAEVTPAPAPVIEANPALEPVVSPPAPVVPPPPTRSDFALRDITNNQANAQNHYNRLNALTYNQIIARNFDQPRFKCASTTWLGLYRLTNQSDDMFFLSDCMRMLDSAIINGAPNTRSMEPTVYGAQDDQWFVASLLPKTSILNDGPNTPLNWGEAVSTDVYNTVYTRTAKKDRLVLCGEDVMYRIIVKDKAVADVNGVPTTLEFRWAVYLYNDLVYTESRLYDNIPGEYYLRIARTELYLNKVDGTVTTSGKGAVCADLSPLDPTFAW